MNLNLTIFLITIIINGGLLILVILKKYKTLKNPAYLSFIFSIVFLLIWTMFNYLADTTLDHAQALFYTRATIPSAFLMFWFIFLFSSFFPRRTIDNRVALRFYFIALSVLSILSMTNMVISDVTIDPSLGISHVSNTSLFFLVMILYILILGQSVCNFYRKFISFQGMEKEQIRCTLIGWSLFLFGAIVVSGLIPLFSDNAIFSKLGPFLAYSWSVSQLMPSSSINSSISRSSSSAESYMDFSLA